MCQLTTIFSGAVSFGVLAGVLTGIFYAVSAGLQWLCKVRLSLEEEAIKSRRGDGLLSERRCINCSNRNGYLALDEFASRNGSAATESENDVKSRRSSRNLSGETDVSPLSQTEESNDPTVEIREKIEKLVEKIVGGSLDGVSVGKLSKHSSYLAMFAKHHDSLCQGLASLHFSLFNGNGLEQESPRAALSALKSSIEKVVEEAVKLPQIKEIIQAPNSAEDTGVESDFSNKSYEDILATAILNKVLLPSRLNLEFLFALDDSHLLPSNRLTMFLTQIIEQSQKRKDRTNVKKSKRTFVRRRKNGNNNNNVEDENDFVYNSDWSDTSRSEQLSLTIEEHIEEITTTYENSDEEEVNDEINFNSAIHFPELGRTIWNVNSRVRRPCLTFVKHVRRVIEVSGDSRRSVINIQGDNGDDENSDEGQDHSSATELVATGNSWEENWLFQKKKLRSRPNSHHPVPVPMLVPNPSKDFRALIGGVDADDLSDMSECSDSVLEDVVLAGEEKEEVATEVYEPANGIAKIEEMEGGSSSLESELSCPSLSQKERDVSIDYEYSQKMDVDLSDRLVRTRSSDSSATEENSEPVKCQIAEREKKKWNHPVPLADNPYSAENIKKREKRKKMEYFRTGCHIETSVEFPSGSLDEIAKEPCKEIYSRDYYVKASRFPTGDPSLRTSPVAPLEPFVESLPLREEGEGTDEKITETRQEPSVREIIAEKTSIMLPNVKELTKKFAKGIEEFKPRPRTSSPLLNGSTGMKKERAPSVRSLVGNEAESSSSNLSVYVSDAPVESAGSDPNRNYPAPGSSGGLSPAGSVESARVGDSAEGSVNSAGESSPGAKGVVKSSSSISKFAGKEVHSLTARSISKEFREELRNNSSRRSVAKVDRGSSGESERLGIASESARNRSPTPPIDLQSKRKFWEEIISNSKK